MPIIFEANIFYCFASNQCHHYHQYLQKHNSTFILFLVAFIRWAFVLLMSCHSIQKQNKYFPDSLIRQTIVPITDCCKRFVSSFFQISKNCSLWRTWNCINIFLWKVTKTLLLMFRWKLHSCQTCSHVLALNDWICEMIWLLQYVMQLRIHESQYETDFLF